MSSTDIDPDIQAAFSSAPPSASSHANIDPDVASAFAPDNASGDTQDKNPVYDPNRHAIGDEFVNQFRGLASGTYHTIASGYKGLYELAATRDPAKAAAAVEAEQARAYRPPYIPYKSPALEKMNQMPSPTLPGDFLGATAERLGASPGLSTALKAGGAVAPMLLASPRGSAAPEASEVPALSAQDVVNKSASAQSMGAAGSGVDVSKLTPETQSEIVSAGKQGLPLNQTALARHAVAEGLPIPQRLTRGMATGNGPLISEEVNSRRTNPEIGAHLDDLNQGLIDNIDELRREAAPQAVGNTHVQNSQALVDSLKDVHLQRKAQWKAEYNAAEQANGGAVQLDGTTALQAADAALKKQARYKLLPQSVQGVMDEIRENNGQMTLDDLEGYRTTMAKASRAAERSPDGGNVSYAIGLARDALEKNVQMQPGASAAAKAHYDAARKMVASDYAEREVNPAYDAAVDDLSVTRRGEKSDLSSNFGNKYVIGGSPANLSRMRNLLGDNEAAQQTMTAVALNHLRESAGILPNKTDGNFSQHGYNSAYAYDIEPRAQELLRDPQIIQHAENIGKVAQWEGQRSKSQYINASNTATSERPLTATARTGMGMAADALTEILPGVPRAGVKLGKAYLGARGEAKSAAAAEAQRRAFVNETIKPGAGLTQP